MIEIFTLNIFTNKQNLNQIKDTLRLRYARIVKYSKAYENLVKTSPEMALEIGRMIFRTVDTFGKRYSRYDRPAGKKIQVEKLLI